MSARFASFRTAALAASLLTISLAGCWDNSGNLLQAGSTRFQLAFPPGEPSTRLLLDGASGTLWRLEGDQWTEVAKGPSVPAVALRGVLGE